MVVDSVHRRMSVSVYLSQEVRSSSRVISDPKKLWKGFLQLDLGSAKLSPVLGASTKTCHSGLEKLHDSYVVNSALNPLRISSQSFLG